MRKPPNCRNRSARRIGIAAAVAALAATAFVRAATLSWDPDSTTSGVQGGDGTWSLDPPNTSWHDGTGNTTWTNATSLATFAGAPARSPSTLPLAHRL